MAKKLLIGAAVLVVLAGVGFWFFFVRDDAPEELSVESGSGTDQPTGERPDSFDGTWTVQSGGDTEAGFRIDEEFVAGAVTNTAVGRSPEVDGSIEIAGADVTEGSFTVDLTALEFTDAPPGLDPKRRAGAMEDEGLETSEFPEASFALTEPIALGEIPEDGSTATFEATGDLTLHGVTKEVTFEVEASVSGDTIRVATADPVPIVLADYEIDPPTAPFLAGVSDEGSFEFLIVLEQA